MKTMNSSSKEYTHCVIKFPILMAACGSMERSGSIFWSPLKLAWLGSSILWRLSKIGIKWREETQYLMRNYLLLKLKKTKIKKYNKSLKVLIAKILCTTKHKQLTFWVVCMTLFSVIVMKTKQTLKYFHSCLKLKILKILLKQDSQISPIWSWVHFVNV